jgi:hypothetical protein
MAHLHEDVVAPALQKQGVLAAVMNIFATALPFGHAFVVLSSSCCM